MAVQVGAASGLPVAVYYGRFPWPVPELLGVQTWYLAGGVVCVAMGIIGFLIPSIARIEDAEPVAAAPGELPSEA